MIYQCNSCEFSAFNEKALQQHIKEKHVIKVNHIVEPVTILDSKKSDSIPIEKPNSEKKENKEHKKPNNPSHGEYNFYIELKGKPVTCEFINGNSIHGLFVGFNQWEIKIMTDEGEVIVYKHSLATVRMGIKS